MLISLFIFSVNAFTYLYFTLENLLFQYNLLNKKWWDILLQSLTDRLHWMFLFFTSCKHAVHWGVPCVMNGAPNTTSAPSKMSRNLIVRYDLTGDKRWVTILSQKWFHDSMTVLLITELSEMQGWESWPLYGDNGQSYAVRHRDKNSKIWLQ